MEQLPVLVVGKMRVDELRGVCQEVEGVKNVADVLDAGPLHDEPSGGPVAVDEAPGPVDEHGVPGVLAGPATPKTHARRVVGALGIAQQQLAVEVCVPFAHRKTNTLQCPAHLMGKIASSSGYK